MSSRTSNASTDVTTSAGITASLLLLLDGGTSLVTVGRALERNRRSLVPVRRALARGGRGAQKGGAAGVVRGAREGLAGARRRGLGEDLDGNVTPPLAAAVARRHDGLGGREVGGVGTRG